MNEEEKKLYLFMKNASPEVLNSFTDDDADEFERLHKLYQSEQAEKKPDTLVDRVRRSGYSGLSEDDKKLFDSQYSESIEANKAKMSLDAVRKYADANKFNPDQYIQNADNLEVAPSLPSVQNMQNDPLASTDPHNPYMTGENPIDALRNAAKDSYGAIRGVLALATSPYTGAWERFTGSGGNINSDKNYSESVKAAEEKGNLGEGLPGFVSDPLNLTMAVPSLGGYVMSSKLGKVAKKAGPVIGETITRGAGGAIEGAGYGLLGSVDPTNDESALDQAKIGSIIGGSLGLGGGLMRGLGKEWFPGLGTQSNRAVDPDTKILVKKNLDQILGTGLFPKSKEGFYNLSDKERELLSKEYDRAVKAISPKNKTWEEYVSQIKNNIETGPTKNLTPDDLFKMAAKFQIDDPLYGSQNNIPFMRNIKDLEDKLKSGYRKRLAKRDALDDKLVKLLVRDILTVVKSKAELFPDISVHSGEELGWVRTNKTNPETYKDPVAEVAMAKKDLGRTWRDVINAELESDPRYAEHITNKVKKDYALWSSLEDVLDAPGKIGLTDRLPGGLSLSPYLKSSSAYKVGQLLSLPQQLRLGARDTDNKKKK